LDRAIDSQGQTIDFLLTVNRDASAAKRFLTQAVKKVFSKAVRVINTDKAKVYPKAIENHLFFFTFISTFCNTTRLNRIRARSTD
jgi:transposase-like protein